MKKALFAMCIVTVCLPLAIAGQSAAPSLKDFTWALPGDDVSLGLVHLNDSTTPLLFQPPTLYSIRAQAHTSTMFYVQGTPTKDVRIDTTNFIIEQDGRSMGSLPTNIKHFEKGKASAPKGERIEGLLTFAKLVDITQPFTVKHGADSVQVTFTSDQIKQMKVAPPAAAEPK